MFALKVLITALMVSVLYAVHTLQDDVVGMNEVKTNFDETPQVRACAFLPTCTRIYRTQVFRSRTLDEYCGALNDYVNCYVTVCNIGGNLRETVFFLINGHLKSRGIPCRVRNGQAQNSAPGAISLIVLAIAGKYFFTFY
ncbi:hypothetical protein PoB_004265100 [Plakobranchus ocellatus]|uniref:Uncharacterized protein n=1 Tax=Plakobranchus ocellatus TaxID=259542 RepID=A0AAV4B6R9_9GAST|nr:hypothetical protein PoB_004265100 [Plakobranchus ocellatus]